MKSPIAASLIALLGTASLGCSASPPATPPIPAKAVAASPAPAPAAKAAAEKPQTKPARRERPPAERAKVAQLFQVPQFNRSVSTSYNDARHDSVGAAPQIRLLGFSRLEGKLRALVQVKGEVLPIEQGDIIDGAEVVAIDDEGVSFQYAGQRWTSRLFEKFETRPVTIARASAPAESQAIAIPTENQSN